MSYHFTRFPGKRPFLSFHQTTITLPSKAERYTIIRQIAEKLESGTDSFPFGYNASAIDE